MALVHYDEKFVGATMKILSTKTVEVQQAVRALTLRPTIEVHRVILDTLA